jgi:uncharacterized protein (DUF934 family)
MAKLIRNRRVAVDSWRLLKPDAEGKLAVPATGDVIVPLSTWKAEREALAGRKGKTGVWLDGSEGPEAIAQDLERLPIVALHFNSFGDGRAFSSARLLRERYGYKGEIRATGQVIRDWLLFMERCGIDSFLLRDDEDAANALQAFEELPEAYQASVSEPEPLFRRRAAKAQAERKA